MSYDTPYFVAFLAVVWLAFRALPWPGYILLAASIVFYAVAGLRDSLIAAALVLANYAVQFPISRNRIWLIPALIGNFGVLAYFKYRVFLTEAAGFDVFTTRIVVPLGISFYVFQLSAFLIDISRGGAEPFRSLARFTLFKLFFGQLIAGPIMRWRQFGSQVNQLFEHRLPARRLIGLGLGLCVLGLTKKIVFADSLAPFADVIFRDGPADAAAAWLGVWLFGFQIYFDFSGYSDIALGLAYLFGLRLAVNFRQPYLARTPQEFWRRWHITLSQWIRDYLYLPLGGRRGGMARQGMVLVLVMALAGLWHGANWTFVIWGVGWGLVVLVWRLAGPALARLGPGEWLLTLAVAMTLWVLFRATDLNAAIAYFATMCGQDSAGTAGFPGDGAGGLLIVAGCLSLLGLHWIETFLFRPRAALLIHRCDGPFLRAFFAGVAVWLVLIPRTQQNPFIYFRF
jgi:alginate O-acetyltransferase complex protein AlgI